ncbi:hypothetical protein RND81_08G221600 [Saponaria officinalis]|uniref:K Homology domain-containing protein n=1 Tax=Saponaria officinalis TaxID=3572 RepID=A0AAW1J9W9_SAPOF
MDGDRRGGSLRGRSNAQFKRKGGGSKKGGRWNESRPEHRGNPQVPNPSDTVYRILCPSKKIGSVIGKGGGIIKVLREETSSKITVSDTIPGSDERVIMIYSPPEKKLEDELDQGSEDVSMPPHCPAQDALLRVHDRIIEEDLLAAKEEGDDANVTVTARLLVPDSMVGCVLGKGGDVIRRLRSETGAGIRVLSSEPLPTCALSTDELVQIQGNTLVVKRALYEVSTLLHQNPRKEKANYSMPPRGSGFHPAPPPLTNMAHGPMWSPRHHSPHMPPPPWMDDYERHPGYGPGRYADELHRPAMEPSGEFSLKILCLDSKIGGVIGKGGINVRQLQQDTGTSIHVEDLSNRSEERVIRVSAFETLANQRSQTIDAILMLQNKASEVSDKGVITTRLLVPSNKVGCLLGQGGAIINEMRRRTHADIRVYAKDEKPEFASEDEELVQVSGSFAVAKDALGEIACRLRERCLRDGGVDAEPALPKPVQGYGPTGSFSRGGPPPLGLGPSGHNAVKGGIHGYASPGYPVPPSASRYPNPNNSGEPHYQSSAAGSVPGAGGSVYGSNPEAADIRMKPYDPYHGSSESMTDIHAGSDHLAPPGTHHSYDAQNIPHQSPYPNPKEQPPYHSSTPQQSAYPSPYPNQHQAPYQNAQQTPYQNPQQPAYQNPQQTAYQNPQQSAYQNTQQTPYQQTAYQGQQNAYPSAATHGGTTTTTGYQY